MYTLAYDVIEFLKADECLSEEEQIKANEYIEKLEELQEEVLEIEDASLDEFEEKLKEAIDFLADTNVISLEQKIEYLDIIATNDNWWN